VKLALVFEMALEKGIELEGRQAIEPFREEHRHEFREELQGPTKLAKL
jgi:hypothetical protein